MVAARAGLSEFPIGDRVEADAFWVAFDPDKQSGPRCIKVLFFVAPGNGEHVWQCLELTCGVTVTCRSQLGAAGSSAAARSAWPSWPTIRTPSSRRAAFFVRRLSMARCP